MKRWNIGLLMAGQWVSVLGDAVSSIGLLVMIFDLTGSSTTTGLVAAAGYLPVLMFGLFAGALVDRLPLLRVMVISDLCRAVLCLLVPLGARYGVLSPWLMAGIAFGMSVFSALFAPARDALVPRVAEGRELSRANSLIQSSAQAGWLIGPFLAALILRWTHSPATLYLIDGMTYLASAGLLLLMRAPQSAASEHPSLVQIGRDVKETLFYLRGNRALRWVLGLSFANNIFIMGPATVGLLLLVKETLRGGDQLYATAEGCIALGMLVTSALYAWRGQPLALGRLWVLGVALDGLTWIPVALARNPAEFLAYVFLHAMFIPMLIIPRTTMIQVLAPPELQGRLFSLVHVSVYGCTGLSVALSGVLAEWIPVRSLVVLAGAGGMICGLLGWLVREIREVE